jgi:hypothetical protein
MLSAAKIFLGWSENHYEVESIIPKPGMMKAQVIIGICFAQSTMGPVARVRV